MTTDERRARLIYVIASQLDRPNVFMGGPSPGAKIRAEYIYDAIRASDEAAGMVLVPRDMIQQARALLAQIMSAGHNVPGPTPEDIESTFWRLDDVIAAATEADHG